MVIYVMIVVVVSFVLGLSLLTISKGYAHKHTVDPLPEDETVQKFTEE